MKQKEFDTLKEQLKVGDNQYLKIIFEEQGAYCIKNIQRKFNCNLADAEDLLIDSILNFRAKVLSGKIKQLTSVRNYLFTTCVNMQREKEYYAHKKQEKEYDVKLFLYDEIGADDSDNEELLHLSVSSFERLGNGCQEILRYFYIYKLSMKEIAAKMNLGDANAAKVKKARCYKKWLEIVKSK